MHRRGRWQAWMVAALMAGLSGCMGAPGDDPWGSCDGSGTCDVAGPDGWSSERTVLEREDELFAFYDSIEASTFASPVDGVSISYKVYRDPNAQAALVISTGRSESHAKWMEVAWDLRNQGFDVYVIDHRGQGMSDRLLDDPLKGYVDDWHDYTADLGYLIDEIVAPEHDQIFALGHSMGGGILAAWATDPANAGKLSAMVLSSPMLGVKFGIPESVAYALAYVAPKEWYAIGNDGDLTAVFEDNKLTTSENRYQLTNVDIQDRYAVRIGGPTYGWVLEAIRMMRTTRDRAEGFSTPMLMLQAGDDRLVQDSREDDFCKAATHCEEIVFPHSRHEIFNGPDEIRDEALDRVLGLFYRHMN